MSPAVRGDHGAALIEYALVVAAIVVTSIVVIGALVGVLGGAYKDDCENVGPGGIAGAPPGCP